LAFCPCSEMTTARDSMTFFDWLDTSDPFIYRQTDWFCYVRPFYLALI
jgi:hypothetical protein